MALRAGLRWLQVVRAATLWILRARYGMWVDTAEGKAFVPDDLSLDAINHLDDSEFPTFFEVVDALKAALEKHESRSVLFQLLFQREAQTFSPRLSGMKIGDLAYVVNPFVPFHIFDSVESFNYARAAQHAWESNRRQPFSKAFLRDIHARLLPDHHLAGHFRQTPIWLGERHVQTAKDAMVVLTPPEMVGKSLAKLASFVEGAPETHRLATCAMVHFQLAAIHPFFDGNGRVIRAITPALLRYFGLIDAPYLFISEMLLEQQWPYYRRMDALEQYGELDAWVQFFVHLLTEGAIRATRMVEIAAHIHADLLCRVKRQSNNKYAEAFVDDMLLSTTFSLSRAAAVLKCDVECAVELINALMPIYGLRKISDANDPVYQLADVYEALAL